MVATPTPFRVVRKTGLLLILTVLLIGTISGSAWYVLQPDTAPMRLGSANPTATPLPLPEGWLPTGPTYAQTAAVLGATVYICGSEHGILKVAVSATAGQSWRATTFAQSGTYCQISGNPTRPEQVAVAIANCFGCLTGWQILASDDGGERWQKFALPLGAQFTKQMTWGEAGVLVAARDGDTSHSVLVCQLTGYCAWSATPFRVPENAFTVLDAANDILYLAPNLHTAFRSTDGGNSWDNIPLPVGATLEPGAAASDALFAADAQRLWLSHDQGKDWQPLPAWLPAYRSNETVTYATSTPDGAILALVTTHTELGEGEYIAQLMEVEPNQANWSYVMPVPQFFFRPGDSWNMTPLAITSDPQGHPMTIWASGQEVAFGSNQYATPLQVQLVSHPILSSLATP